MLRMASYNNKYDFSKYLHDDVVTLRLQRRINFSYDFSKYLHDVDSISPRCDYNVESIFHTIFQNIYTMSIRYRHVAITTSNQFSYDFTRCRFDIATLRLQHQINFSYIFKMSIRC